MTAMNEEHNLSFDSYFLDRKLIIILLLISEDNIKSFSKHHLMLTLPFRHESFIASHDESNSAPSKVK